MALLWWSNWPTWRQILTACIPLLLSTALLFVGYIRPWGFAIGIALLAFSGNSDAYKKGYRDF